MPSNRDHAEYKTQKTSFCIPLTLIKILQGARIYLTLVRMPAWYIHTPSTGGVPEEYLNTPDNGQVTRKVVINFKIRI